VRPLIDRPHAVRTLRRVQRLHPSGDPGTDYVVTAAETVRVVGVQTLDASARAADAAPGPRLMEVAGPILGRLLVRGGDRHPERLVLVRTLVEPCDPAVGLQPGDGLDRVGT